MVLINEFPKCGASWVRKMLSDYLGVNQSNGNNNSHGWLGRISKNAIIQRHWLNQDFNVAKTILVVRDPRDVYNSYYFHETYFRPRAKALNAWGYVETDDDRTNMERYLRFKLLSPRQSLPGFTYSELWGSYRNHDNVCVVKYEDLLVDAATELGRVLNYLGVEELDEVKLLEIIDQYSFENMSKRKKGQANNSSHTRKGIVGDWRNYFNEQSVTLVKQQLHDFILELGYETTADWQ